MIEQWKPIAGYSGDYEISDRGRILSRKGKKVRLLKQRDNGRGYLHVTLWADGKRQDHRIHRLVIEAFIPSKTKGLEAHHRDGNKHHNHASNLAWITHKDNIIHAIRTGLKRCVRGEKHGRAKLTATQVKEIRCIHAESHPTQERLAAMFDISESNVRRIIHRASWCHIA